jgi:hypothetical protein
MTFEGENHESLSSSSCAFEAVGNEFIYRRISNGYCALVILSREGQENWWRGKAENDRNFKVTSHHRN